MDLQDPLKAERLLDALFDFLLDQPLADLIGGAPLQAYVEPAQLAALLEAHLPRALARAKARAEARGGSLGDLLPEDLQRQLLAWAGEPVRFNQEILQAIIRQESTRHLLKSVVQASLERFVDAFKGMTPASVEGATRLMGGFAKRAGGGLLGGLTGQIEAQLRRAITHFVGGSLTLLLDQLILILSAEQSARLLGDSRRQAVEALLKTPQAEALARLEALDPRQLSAALTALLGLHLGRVETRADVEAELAAFLEVEGAKPLRGFINEAAARATLRAVGPPLLAAFARQPKAPNL
ncbi:hypothetical protein KKF91_14565 [Myxococcota bacterium]|nr:hypothetical protein [Myxococcota bacterium]MBU1431764.1 hypothetical protein [Myxococcota bacterium]MBU1897459.1 hypothetical protein [Myxococcota bacterium]